MSGPITQGAHLTAPDVRAKQSRWSMEDPPIHADMVKATEADTVLGRFGETSEFAAVLAFPASDEGRWITAQVIEASGGYPQGATGR